MESQQTEWSKVCFVIRTAAGNIKRIELGGRMRWALEQLMNAGSCGVSPAENPAPRWSSYIHKLRMQGIQIETTREKAEGPFSGWFGRYHLRTLVWRSDLPPLEIGL